MIVEADCPVCGKTSSSKFTDENADMAHELSRLRALLERAVDEDGWQLGKNLLRDIRKELNLEVCDEG